MDKLDPSILDTKTNLVNLSNSLLKHYGVETFHPSIPEVDQLLEGRSKVALFLFDGLGEYILDEHQRQSRYILQHKFMTIHSVNPATTVACTTALLTGRYPIENGYMGWSLYFPDHDFPIDVFPNENSLTGEKLSENVIQAHCPITYISDLIAQAGHHARAALQYPLWDEKGPKKLKDIRTQGSVFFHEGGEFLYCYWTDPDHTLHHRGVHAHQVSHRIRQISHTIKAFAKANPDVLVLVVADHGLIDVQYRDIEAFPEIASLQRKAPALEGRTCSFYLKDGTEKRFSEAFNKEFGKYFILKSKQELLDEHYFGEGEINPFAKEMIGDVVALAVSNQILVDSVYNHNFKVHEAHHAGATEEERAICLSVYNR
jgi:predicted AlkP superfamily pyrophosphatase or phosphodiesterase